MCGRYYSLFDKQPAAEYFHVRHIANGVGPSAPNYKQPSQDPFLTPPTPTNAKEVEQNQMD
jgi:hypothetical protein